jgi:hypothetical protein
MKLVQTTLKRHSTTVLADSDDAETGYSIGRRPNVMDITLHGAGLLYKIEMTNEEAAEFLCRFAAMLPIL